MHLLSRKILITGATSGIGEALTRQLLALDNQVIAVGRQQDKLAHMAAQYPRLIPVVADLAQPAEIERLCTLVRREHPDLSLLINNAGIQYNYLFGQETQLSDKISHEVMTNLMAPLQLTALLWPVLEAQPDAAVVQVSSALGLVPKKSAAVYCATKAGLHLFSKALRAQDTKVRVVEVIPPLVDTAMTAGRGTGKMQPEQVAAAILNGLRHNESEITIGKAKLLRFIQRLSPALADRIMINR